MAKKQNPWIPSGGVLIVAVICAIVAAVLVTLYTGHVRGRYELGSQVFLQLRSNVPAGKPFQTSDLEYQRIPKPLLDGGAFAKAIKAEDATSIVVGKKARRAMYKGEFLYYFDFVSTDERPALEDVPAGYEMITIPVEPERLLQPGLYVTIRGEYDLNPDPKADDIQPVDVIYNVQVKAIGGSTESMDTTKRPPDNVQIMLRQSQVKQLLQLQGKLVGKKQFSLAVSGAQKNVVRSEPAFSDEALKLLEGGTPAAPPLAP
jgi:hypothetical protein